MFHRPTVQSVLHIVIRMRSSDHERQLAKTMAVVGSSTCSPGVSLHECFDEERTERKHGKENRKRSVSKVDTALEHLFMCHALMLLWAERNGLPPSPDTLNLGCSYYLHSSHFPLGVRLCSKITVPTEKKKHRY